jgi:hypothetical protein
MIGNELCISDVIMIGKFACYQIVVVSDFINVVVKVNERVVLQK